MGLYVQYGCGLCAPDGWLNFDASPGLRLRKTPLIGRWMTSVPWPKEVRFGDIRKGLPVSEASVDVMYCSHVLEHLALEDCRKALRNTFRSLRSGGVFRLVLPDLKAMATQYVASSGPEAARRFMDSTLLGRPSRPAGFSGLMRAWLGNVEHMWMWDYESLAAELNDAGFVGVRRAVMGDSGDPMFAQVEEASRWTGSLGMQASKA